MTTVPNTAPKTIIASRKSIAFRYKASADLSILFDCFRRMCNDAVRIAVQGRPKNRFRLLQLAYPRLKEYGLHTHYILAACEVAFSAYSNKKRKSFPYFEKCFLKLDNQSYRLNHLLLRIPTTSRKFVFLTLQGSDYHLSFVDDPRLKRGSVTITESTVSITFSKETELINPVGFVGVDLNEKNVTASAADGWTRRFDELRDIAEIRERYRGIRTKISQTTRGDRRVAKELLAKYGKREKRRIESRVHKVTSQLVNHAAKNRLGIKMEKLTGIRRLYMKGNGQSISLRGRMNSWVFRETQRQIDYKAKWDGVPTWYVNPRGTSSYCPNCGSRVVPLVDRKLYCPKCDITWDRDDLASKNIMACAVPQARPSRGSGEGERGDDGSNPRSRWGEGKPKRLNTTVWIPEPGRVCSAS